MKKTKIFTLTNLLNFVVVILIILGGHSGSFAQPANDECDGAIELPMGQENCRFTKASNIGATPSIGSGNLNDIWFKTTAESDLFTVAIGWIPYDGYAYVHIYEGGCNNPERVLTFALYFESFQEKTITGLVPGKEYFITVETPEVQPEGDLNICVRNSEAQTLPLDLMYFNSEAHNDFTLLKWRSTNESNTNYISIEKSSDSEDWEEIGIVNCDGFRTEVKDYEWKDYNVSEGNSYYRLKIIDRDGHFTYSNVVNVFRAGENRVSISPNPTTDVIVVSNPEWKGKVSFQVFTTTGQNVYNSIVEETQEHRIDMGALPKGIYFLKVRDNTNKKVLKFAKR